jgi:tetratricopeptide (TPR) repeat protein
MIGRIKTIVLVAIFLQNVVLVHSQKNDNQAIEYNQLGVNEIQKGNYLKSLSFFEKSISINKEYMEPYINYINTVSDIFFDTNSDLSKSFDIYAELGYCITAIDYCTVVIKKNPGFRKVLDEDEKYTALRRLPYYYIALGYLINSVGDIYKILVGVPLWSLPEKLDTDIKRSWIHFHKDYTLEFHNFLWENNNFEYEKIVRGTFSVYKNGEEVLIKINTEQKKMGTNVFYGNVEIKDYSIKLYIKDITNDKDFINVPFHGEL